mgnify:CR=1 FL=1
MKGYATISLYYNEEERLFYLLLSKVIAIDITDTAAFTLLVGVGALTFIAGTAAILLTAETSTFFLHSTNTLF